jgi:23S rRNA pseudouridine2605 synthase
VTRPAKASFVTLRTRATWLEVSITEGRNHQVRHLCARSGFPVLKLRRIRLGPLVLGDLTMRWCRPLEEVEIAALYAAALPEDPRPPVEPIPVTGSHGT